MTSPGRGFAMVPAWLAWKQPSANALLVYVHLALFGTFNPGTATYEQCRPSKRTLAEGDLSRGYPGTGLGEQTVGRALRELVALGAIRGEPSFHPVTGAQGPTVYRLVFGQVHEQQADPHITGDTGPGITPDTGGISPPIPGGISPVIPNLEVRTKNHVPRPPNPRKAGEPVSSGAKEPDPGQQPSRCEHGLLACRTCGTSPRQQQAQAEAERVAARRPCPRHRGEWADTCGRCRADRLAGEPEPPGERMTAAAARKLARQAAASRGEGEPGGGVGETVRIAAPGA